MALTDCMNFFIIFMFLFFFNLAEIARQINHSKCKVVFCPTNMAFRLLKLKENLPHLEVSKIFNILNIFFYFTVSRLCFTWLSR